jgi:copper ion binding protein
MRKAISIEGMSCEHCVKHVTNALNELSGVENVDVNLSAGRAIIDYRGEIKDSDIKSAIDEAGYDVLTIEEAQ